MSELMRRVASTTLQPPVVIYDYGHEEMRVGTARQQAARAYLQRMRQCGHLFPKMNGFP